MNARLLCLAALVAAAVACIDFELEGTACNEDGTCAEGLVCNSANLCVHPSDGGGGEDDGGTTDGGPNGDGGSTGDAGTDAGVIAECSIGETERCGAGQGVCESVRACQNNQTWGACSTPGTSSAEVCDNLDNDCDGETDEATLGGPLRNGVPCEKSGASCTPGSTHACVNGAYETICGVASYGNGYEAAERSCDSQDNDCDGQIDVSRIFTLVDRPVNELRMNAFPDGGFGAVFYEVGTGSNQAVRYRAFSPDLVGDPEVTLSMDAGHAWTPDSTVVGDQVVVAWAQRFPVGGGNPTETATLYVATVSRSGQFTANPTASMNYYVPDVSVSASGSGTSFLTAHTLDNEAKVGGGTAATGVYRVQLSPASNGYGFMMNRSPVWEVQTRDLAFGNQATITTFDPTPYLSSVLGDLKLGPTGPELGFSYIDSGTSKARAYVIKPGGALAYLGEVFSTASYDFVGLNGYTFGIILQGSPATMKATWAVGSNAVTPLALAGDATAVAVSKVTNDLVFVTFKEKTTGLMRGFYYCPNYEQTTW